MIYHSPRFWSVSTACATIVIILILFIIVGNIVVNGIGVISWHFISGGTKEGMFDIEKASIFPMIFGTSALVMLMTIFAVPVGVITGIYLIEYGDQTTILSRMIRISINNLAGVPSIVFGLFGLGFFVRFVGGGIDTIFFSSSPEPVYGKPAIIWAALTMAVLTLPVVIVATEEALKAIPVAIREASLALGATKLQTIYKVVLPQAMPGILTGSILAISRGAGEVAPILFVGAAYFLAHLPIHLNDQFMNLGYHIFVLSTQSPDIEATEPILYGTVFVLLALTFLLNLVAILVRAKMRSMYS
ncbi:MAG: phosphate ABC transporter permease PstA [Nitrospirota bacterium]